MEFVFVQMGVDGDCAFEITADLMSFALICFARCDLTSALVHVIAVDSIANQMDPSQSRASPRNVFSRGEVTKSRPFNAI